jgi:hypothetical protein
MSTAFCRCIGRLLMTLPCQMTQRRQCGQKKATPRLLRRRCVRLVGLHYGIQCFANGKQT